MEIAYGNSLLWVTAREMMPEISASRDARRKLPDTPLWCPFCPKQSARHCCPTRMSSPFFTFLCHLSPSLRWCIKDTISTISWGLFSFAAPSCHYSRNLLSPFPNHTHTHTHTQSLSVTCCYMGTCGLQWRNCWWASRHVRKAVGSCLPGWVQISCSERQGKECLKERCVLSKSFKKDKHTTISAAQGFVRWTLCHAVKLRKAGSWLCCCQVWWNFEASPFPAD